MRKLCIALLILLVISVSGLPESPISAQSAIITAANLDKLAERSRLSNGAAKGLLWSADGRTLAVYSSTGLWIYDVAKLDTPRQKLDMPDFIKLLEHGALSPDGKLFLGTAGDFLYLWDVQTGKLKHTINTYRQIYTAIFSPDGRFLIYAGEYNAFAPWAISVWDVQANKMYASLYGHTGDIIALAFSPDGKQLGSYAQDDTIRLWSIDGKQKPVILKLPEDISTSGYWYGMSSRLAFSPDGTTLAINYESYSSKSYLRESWIGLVNIQDGKTQSTLQAVLKDDEVQSFMNDSQSLLISNATNFMIWDIKAARMTDSVRGTQPSLSPDGATIAYIGSDGQIRLWDTHQRKTTGSIQGFTVAPLRVIFSPNSKILASMGDGSAIYVWDAQTGKLLNMLDTAGSVNNIAFSADSTELDAAVCMDEIAKLPCPTGQVQVWNWATLKIINTIRLPMNAYLDSGTTFSVDGKLFAYVACSIPSQQQCPPQTIIVDVQTGSVKMMVNYAARHGDASYEQSQLRFSSDASFLAIWGSTEIALEDIANQRTIGLGKADTLAFSANNALAVAYTPYYESSTLTFWQAGEKTSQLFVTVFAPLFSPDGKLITATTGDSVLLWNYQHGNQYSELKSAPLDNYDYLLRLFFNKDGSVLVGSTHDGVAEFWDMDKHKLKRTLPLHRAMDYQGTYQEDKVVFSPDGMTLSLVNPDETISLWQVTP